MNHKILIIITIASTLSISIYSNALAINENIVPTNSTILYESKEGKLIYQRVVNVIGYPQIEVSVIEHGILRGIGNVTDIQTWLDTYMTSNTIYGEGKGIMISADGQMAPWIGYGIGQTQNNGTALFKDIIIFSDNATGNMKFLDNQIGLRIATVQENNQTTKIFKW
jgi:hypothetical protein